MNKITIAEALKKLDNIETITLEESSTSRLYKNFTDDDISFAIISASRPNEDNKDRTKNLKRDVRKLGLGFNEFVGRWVEDGESFDEDSLLIPNISFKDAFKLGQKYNQSSIIYKDKDGVAEYCTTPFETYSVGDIVRKYNIDKNNPLNTNMAKEIFSGNVCGPASMLKKGSNKKPFNFTEELDTFELFEKQLLNTRLGFTNTKIILNKC